MPYTLGNRKGKRAYYRINWSWRCRLIGGRERPGPFQYIIYFIYIHLLHFWTTFVYFSEYRLIAFISHMGTSTMCGHYVCHVLKEGRYSFLYLIFPPFEPNFTLFLFSIIFINVYVVYLRFKGARLRMSQLERKFFKIVYKLPLSSLFLIVLIYFFFWLIFTSMFFFYLGNKVFRFPSIWGKCGHGKKVT